LGKQSITGLDIERIKFFWRLFCAAIFFNLKVIAQFKIHC